MSVVAEYTYTDAKSQPVARVDRIEPGRDGRGKEFLPYAATRTGFADRPGLNGAKLPWYDLPSVLAAAREHADVYVCEGEGKADRLDETWGSRRDGWVAFTTIAGGAKSPLLPQHLDALAGAARVFMLADSDKPGREAAQLRAQLIAQAHPQIDVRVIDLYPDRIDGSDIADWLDEGRGLEELDALVEGADRIVPTAIADDTQTGAASADALNLTTWNDVRLERISWLMIDRLPLGELTIVEGDGGLGKTTAVLDWAARLSTGRPMPDGTPVGEAGDVLLIAEEDRVSVLKARLLAAGADLRRIHHVDSVGENRERVTLPTHARAIYGATIRLGARLVYIDALFSHFDEGLKSNNTEDARRVLGPLSDIAHDTGAAMIATRHWGKSARAASSRGLGSIDITNIARSVLTVGRHPHDDQGPRLIAVAKSNLGRDHTSVPSLSYVLEPATITEGCVQVSVARVCWGDEVTVSADELANAAPATTEERSQVGAAVEAIREILADGPRLGVEVQDILKRDGYSRPMVFRARKKAGVESRMEGFPAKATWSITSSLTSSLTPPQYETAATAETPEATTVARDHKFPDTTTTAGTTDPQLSQVSQQSRAKGLETARETPDSPNGAAPKVVDLNSARRTAPRAEVIVGEAGAAW